MRDVRDSAASEWMCNTGIPLEISVGTKIAASLVVFSLHADSGGE